jgi:hypothetical protein
VRKLFLVLLAFGLALPVLAKQVSYEGVVSDVAKILFLGEVFSDVDCCSRFEPIIKVLNKPSAFSQEPLLLYITGTGIFSDMYLYLARNDGGKDTLIYSGILINDGSCVKVPAPAGGWLIGTYPIKIILSNIRFDVKDGKLVLTNFQYCCANIEVEQILITIQTPPCCCCCCKDP